jgi:trimethylamine--corrinoid protein Co-methyltransferase
MPTPGATAPGTLAGYLVQYLAESFGFTTIGRLLCNPPREVPAMSSGGDDITAMDMRKAVFFLAGPDVSLMRMGMKQMLGEFYKCPGSHCCEIRTFTDAKEPGIQAAVEKTFQAMCDLMMGMYSDDPVPVARMACAGSLNTNLALSLEQAVIDYDLFQMLNRLLAGIRTDEDALGFEAIRRVGPSGEFLSDEHTRRHGRTEWWFPALFHRGAWDMWRADGRPDVVERAREIVLQSKRIDVPCVLPEDAAREVDRLVQAAERDLLGSTTGLLP